MPGAGDIIAPFRGIRYHTAGSRDLSSRIAPPYDIIAPAMQADLYARDQHNFVRLELPQPSDRDGAEDDRYQRAAATLRDWLAQRVLVRDERPALYLVEQEFQLRGRAWRRRGVFALVRLPEANERYVLSHEGTLAAPKADRLHLMRACHAMTSPILMMSEDGRGELLSLLEQTAGEAEAVAANGDGVAHRLWPLHDAGPVEAICAAVGAGPLFIADGHHRFETAVTCRDEMRQRLPQASAQAGFNYALALVTSAQDEGVKILPTHRVLSGLGEAGLGGIRARIAKAFDVRQLAVPKGDELPALTWPDGGAARGHVYGAYWGDGHYYVLTARGETAPAGTSSVASLDVSVLHRRLIDPVLSKLGKVVGLAYVTDEQQALEAVARGDCDLALFLRSTRVSEVLAVARAGERMPGKSTYFYPKAPAGLVLSDASAEPI
jgi:uncharacterized protein (DUF1015 family)